MTDCMDGLGAAFEARMTPERELRERRRQQDRLDWMLYTGQTDGNLRRVWRMAMDTNEAAIAALEGEVER